MFNLANNINTVIEILNDHAETFGERSHLTNVENDMRVFIQCPSIEQAKSVEDDLNMKGFSRVGRDYEHPDDETIISCTW